MKKLLFTLLAILFFTSCEKDSITDLQSDQILEESDLDLLKKPGPKIEVCHKGKSYRVPEKQLAKHTAHGDVQLIDEDGDGWVTMLNECGIPVDCDDTDSEVTSPEFIEATVFYESFFDLETGLVTDPDEIEKDTDDLVWVRSNNGPLYFWNESQTNVAFVYNKTFCELTFNDVGDYYYCVFNNVSNDICNIDIISTDDSVGIYRTFDGNYWVVEVLNSSLYNVTFRYRQLLDFE